MGALGVIGIFTLLKSHCLAFSDNKSLHLGMVFAGQMPRIAKISCLMWELELERAQTIPLTASLGPVLDEREEDDEL